MLSPTALFHEIANDIPNALESKLFGTTGIKLKNGKTAAIFWQDCMLFKLNDLAQKEALKLDAAKIASHLYAPDKPMKGWITIPFKHSNTWKHFTKLAVEFVMTIKK